MLTCTVPCLTHSLVLLHTPWWHLLSPAPPLLWLTLLKYLSPLSRHTLLLLVTSCPAVWFPCSTSPCLNPLGFTCSLFMLSVTELCRFYGRGLSWVSFFWVSKQEQLQENVFLFSLGPAPNHLSLGAEAHQIHSIQPLHTGQSTLFYRHILIAPVKWPCSCSRTFHGS